MRVRGQVMGQVALRLSALSVSRRRTTRKSRLSAPPRGDVYSVCADTCKNRIACPAPLSSGLPGHRASRAVGPNKVHSVPLRVSM